MTPRSLIGATLALAFAVTAISTAAAQYSQKPTTSTHKTLARKSNEDKELKKHIQLEMNKFAAAFKKKDQVGIEAVLRENFAPDFQAKEPNGKTMGLDDMIKAEEQHMQELTKVNRISLKVHKVNVNGDTATITESFFMEGNMPNQKNPKKSSKLHVDSQSTTTLKRENGKWWVASMLTNKEKVLIDGKPAPPGM